MTESIDAQQDFSYKNTPAYRRKVKRDRAKAEKKAGLLQNQGPITLIIIGLIDNIIDMFTSLGLMIWDFAGTGFQFVYGSIYGSYDGVIPNSEKFGMIVPMTPMRYLITILIPPLGVFLSKGLSGWFNILICFVLTFIHFLLGAIYAFVITYRNRYADRYEQVEKQRLLLIREYVKSCTGDADQIVDPGDDTSPATLIYTVIFFICFFGALAYAFKFM